MLLTIDEKIKELLNGDDVLFHYTGLNIGIEKILSERKMRFSNPSNFTDIREKLGIEPNWFNPARKSDKRSLKRMKNILDLSKKLQSEYRILCFCSNDQKIENSMISIILKIINPDNFFPVKLLKGYQKDRMWDNYANHYKGFCFAFRKSSLIECLKTHQDFSFIKADYVSYNEKVYLSKPSVVLSKHPIREAESFLEGDKFFLKHYDYKEENEFRVLIKLNKNKIDTFDITNNLSYVILGSDFPEVYKSMVSNLIKELNDNRVVTEKVSLLEYHINESGLDQLIEISPENY